MALIDKASLLMVPSTYEAGTLYNVLPSGNRAPDETGSHSGYDQTRADFSFDRGSNAAATRIDENGVLQKYRENLLTYSNDFSQWVSNNTSETSGQSGYDGSSDAWLLDITGGTSSQRLEQSITNSGIQTFSIYVKAGTLYWVRLRTDGSTTRNVYFDLQNGVVGTSSAIDAKIQDVGSGWFRCSLVTDDVTRVRIYPADADGDITHTSGNIYIQDAQLESGLVSTDVLTSGATTAKAGVLIDLPRIDYSSGAGALLLEPQRTNAVTHSEYFGAWSAFRATITDNATTSPEGIINAAVLTEDTTNNSHPLNKTFSVSSGAEYTLSIFAKQGSRRYLALLALNGGSTIYYDLENKTAGSGGSVEDYGNGWLRLIYTYTTNSTSAELYIQPSVNGSSVVYTGDGSNAVFLYGAQLEAGSYVSSYIPNHGESGGVTRAADVCNGGGSAESINSVEGVLYAEISGLSNDTVRISISDGTNNNNIYIELDSSNVNSVGRAGGSNQFTLSSSQTITNNNKVAIKYKANDFALYVNGTEVATDTSGNTYSANTLTSLQFDRGDGGILFYGNVKQVAVFNEALSDSELETLTTL